KQADLELSGYAQRLLGQLRAIDGDLSAARSAIDQSISCFKTTKSRYQSALSHMEMGRVLCQLGEVALAETHLQAAERTFAELGVNSLRNRALALLAELPRQTIMPPETAVAIPAAFDSVLVERLVEAAHQRELLLRELTSIVRDMFVAPSVMVFELNEKGDFVPIVCQGLANANPTRVGERIRLHLDGGRTFPPETIVRQFTDRNQKELVLYAAATQPVVERRLEQLQTLLRLAEQCLEVCALRERLRTTKEFDLGSLRCLSSMPGFLVASPAMKTVLEQIHKIRSSSVTVLITGESGTGKELVARAIHLESERRDRDFVPFNCAAVAKDIVESRLFGHRKGAFTGASQDQRGVIRAAEGGTLFLDEVGELPIDVQPKLLRFLQEGEIHALGDDRPTRVNVRVLAATNRDLEKQVSKGLFREDLFHRLNVIRIHVPPLRERREEILPLAEHFLKRFSERMSKSVRLSEEAADKLVAYDWPGNVRQLQNEIERVVAYAEERHIVTIDELSSEIINFRRANFFYGGNINIDGKARIAIPPGITLGEAIEALERQMVTEALKRHNGNISRTARQLGLTRKGLQLKRSRLGI
ncbi:MAG: sigma-54 dependent transcriptional regulator, partial [Acidobacteriota bacterium]